MSQISIRQLSFFTTFLLIFIECVFARHFNPLDSQTGATLTIFLDTASHPTLNGTPIRHDNVVPDEIGVFDSVGNCWGVGYWPAGPDTAFAVAGYNNTGVIRLGMKAGATMHFRLWDTTLGEMPAGVTYYPPSGTVPFPPNIIPSTCSTFVAGSPIAYSVPMSISGQLPPSAVALISPSDNANNMPISLSLAWNSSASATSYSVQVSTNFAFNTPIVNYNNSSDTLSVTLASGTKYYWRVAAQIGGVSSAWVVDSFYTMLAPPGLLTPLNNSTTNLNPILSWNSSSGATNYNLQVSTNSLFLTDVVDTSQVSTSKQVSPLSNNTQYYWHSYSFNAIESSAWSTTYSFIVPPAPTPVTLFSPSDNAKNVASKPTLKWTSSLEATGYSIQIATNATFSLGCTNLTAAMDTLSVNLGAGIKFFWRVAASNAVGSSSWAMDSFTTSSTPPPGPTLASPLNGSINVPVSTYLNWNALSNATSYRVQLCNSTAFEFVTDTTTTNTDRSIIGLSSSTTYYWRVNATNAYGTSLWSIVDSFTTVGGPPSVPVLVYPPSGSLNIPMNPILTWGPSPGATTYEIQISPYSTFSMLTDTIVAIPQRYAGVLSAHTTYYWHVDAINSYGTSSWAATNSFTTGNVGVINGPPCLKTFGLGYNGTLSVYSLDGRQILKIPFTCSETKEAMLMNANKIAPKGFYSYQFLKERHIMDEGNFVVK
jgi:hypothetical protein